MKSFIFAAFGFMAATGAFAQTQWKIDAAHSSVKFSVSHMMISETEGNFKKFDGTISTPKADDVAGGQVEFTVDVASVNTDNEARDKHLCAPDFFDAAKFPSMTFKSTSFKKGKKNNYMLEGNMTIHGVTKAVKIPVKFGGIMKDPWGNTKAGFKAQFVIDRAAYQINGGKGMVGNEVNVVLNIELAKA